MGLQSSLLGAAGAISGAALGIKRINEEKMKQANKKAEDERTARIKQNYHVRTVYQDKKSGRFTSKKTVDQIVGGKK